MNNNVEILKALADSNRFKLVELLLQHDYCVGALAKRLELTEAAVSQHLKSLREAGLVWGEKRGYFTHYSVNKDVLKNLSEEFMRLYYLNKSSHTDCASNCHKKSD